MVEKIMMFGLTRQEATIYICLCQNGAMNGYETAKLTGISRSNVYSALAGLVEKGAAYLMEGASNKYVAVPVEEFCENHVRRMTEAKQYLMKNLVQTQNGTDGYITIEGHHHICDKIQTMLSKVKYRLYVSLPACYLLQYLERLETLAQKGIKVVLLTDEHIDCSDEIHLYVSGPKEQQIHLIVDSLYVLTGDYSQCETDTCLYSGQKNFVNVLKEALRNEIRLVGKENNGKEETVWQSELVF